MALGDCIRAAREGLGWTQSHLAAQIGVTPSFITRIEKQQALPSFDRLQALAHVLGLDSETLLTRLEEAQQHHAQQRLRARGAAARPAAGGTPAPAEGAAGPDVPLPAPLSTAEQFRQEVLADPDFRTAFTWLRLALADPHLKPAVLTTLAAWARQAQAPP